ncbi:MAG: M28 family peptidase, partial [Pseudomonadota bacterium]
HGVGRSVIGRLPAGVAPVGAPLVVGAHIDHIGEGETETSLARDGGARDIHPGADDNASGVAVLIEIARGLARAQAAGELGLRRDILFAAWSGEEIGLLGSTAFIAAHGSDGTEPVAHAYLNLDMVGRLRDVVTVAGTGSSAVWPALVAAANDELDLPIRLVESPYLPTDATPFYLAGVPVLSLTTGAHADYHTPADTPATLNYAGLVRVSALAQALAVVAATSDAALPYAAVRRPASHGATRRADVWLGTVPDYAREGEPGVPISGTVADSPAARAGLRAGDAIVGLAGIEIATIHDFVHLLNGLRAEEPIVIEVRRDGERLALPITPTRRRTP